MGSKGLMLENIILNFFQYFHYHVENDLIVSNNYIYRTNVILRQFSIISFEVVV